MKTLAVVFCYKRPTVLWHCLNSLFKHTENLPDELLCIDDGCTPEVAGVLADMEARYGERTNWTTLIKAKPAGFTHSLQFAFQRARACNPRFLWLIESDYVFAAGGLDAVADVLEHSEEGQRCFGVCGYDHPDFSRPAHRENNYPREMAAMVGEDNVNRPALWQPRAFTGRHRQHLGELASNTCISSYLNWRHLREVAVEWYQLDQFLTMAADPAPGVLASARCADDGMLSNGLNLVWNWWAKAHAIDRDRFACWLNLKPSVANHISGGGLHATPHEMTTDAASPSWTGRV